MGKDPLTEGVLTEGSGGANPVTRERVHARARELALRAGRMPADMTQAHYEQAKRELTGASETVNQEAILDSWVQTMLRRVQAKTGEGAQ
jgi:hypothetical protein